MTIPRAQFEDLVRRHAAAVYRTATRLLSAADAEDVTQQVFARAWEGKAALEPDPAASLCWLAGRLALNNLRSARTRRRNEEARAMQTPDQMPGHDPITADEHRALGRALSALPPDLHTAVVLRFHDDMTFQGIAHALACAESTAHERVRRGIERLRLLLARAGFAALGLRLDAVLPRTAAATPAPPTALEAQLLALPDATLVAAATSKSLAGVLVATAVVGAFAVGAVAFLMRDPSPAAALVAPATHPDVSAAVVGEPPPVRRVVAGVASTANAEDSTPQDQGRANEPQGRITGNVFDAATGHPLADCVVHATSWARGQKGRAFVIDTKTDATGRYLLELPVSARGKEAYSVWVSLADYVHYASGATTVVADQTLELRIPMRRWAVDAPGVWQMDIAVTDPDGRPLADALVVVQRRQPDADEGQPEEANATTDASGRASLRGTHHGEKVVRVTKPNSGFAPASRDLTLSSSGPHALEIRLEPGVALAGRLRAAADGTPIARVSLRANQDGEQIGWATTDAEGRFRFEGLSARPVEVFLFADGWSPFQTDGLLPGREEVDLQVKAAIDPSPRGLFYGELHGTAVDAATSTPVDLSVWDVEPVWLAPDVGDWQLAVLDEALNPRPAQRSISGRPRDPAPDFHVTSLRAGRYALIVRDSGHAPTIAGPFDVGPGRLRAGIDVRLQHGGTVHGVVRDADGNQLTDALFWVTANADPLPEARQTAASLAGGDRYAGYRYHRKPDETGTFTLEHLPPGISLRAVSAHATLGVAVSAPFVLREGTDLRVELRLAR